jgi:hypothetical protein
LSSAILYVAIVVIWACVLIPRWLRRDSSAPASVAAMTAEAKEETVADPAAEEEPTPAPPPRRRRSEAPLSRERRAARVPDEAHADLVDPAHRRVLSARRRLMLMLVVLSIAAGGLAGTRMAAWWVIVPPSVMLLGYLLLLRAAAKADAERREMARYRKAHAAAETERSAVRRQVPAAPVTEAKIISIPAAPEPPEQELYDQYADAKLRAVGD